MVLIISHHRFDMKYIIYTLSLLLVTLLGCKPPHTHTENALSVSIEPQKYFLEAIVGNKYTVNTAIPSGSNPESYDPSPSQMVNIGKSKMFFKVGNLGFENTWLNNISINNPDLQIVDCSVGIPIIMDDHGHAGHSHEGSDPHIWSSPSTALIISKNMYNSIVGLDPKHTNYYLERYKNLEKVILTTDSTIQSYLSEAPSKSFIIFHPALSYFADQYGLNQYSIEVDGKTPTPQQMSNLIQEAKKDNVKVIFVQEEYDQKNAEPIAKELGAEIVSINPLSYSWNEELIKIAKAIAQKHD